MRRLPGLLILATLTLTACAVNNAATPAGMMGSSADMQEMMQRHMAPIPVEYANLTDPIPANAESLARGKTTYEANCAACHGQGGWGDGPAAASLNPAPAPVAHTAPMLSDAYLFYRVSEGGDFAPFHSAMPAWKDKLNESERWDVINYVRSLGGSGMMGDGRMGGNRMGGDMMWWMMAPTFFLGWVWQLAS